MDNNAKTGRRRSGIYDIFLIYANEFLTSLILPNNDPNKRYMAHLILYHSSYDASIRNEISAYTKVCFQALNVSLTL